MGGPAHDEGCAHTHVHEMGDETFDGVRQVVAVVHPRGCCLLRGLTIRAARPGGQRPGGPPESGDISGLSMYFCYYFRMTTLIQARMSDELAAAARHRAKEQETSLSAYLTDLVRRDVETARREKFWAEVERTMTTPEARADLAAEVEAFSGTLTDGLER